MSRSTSSLLLIFCLIITFPFWIGIIGGLFGLLAGLGGAIIGIAAGIMGAIAGVIGGIVGIFDWSNNGSSWHFMPVFSVFKLLFFVVLIFAIVMISKSRKK